MVNTEIILIIFYAAQNGDALYSQEIQDWVLIMAQIMNSYCQIQTYIEESGENHFSKPEWLDNSGMT